MGQTGQQRPSYDELAALVLALRGEMDELKAQVAELMAENAELRAENAELKRWRGMRADSAASQNRSAGS